jgi:hypothetical protein
LVSKGKGSSRSPAIDRCLALPVRNGGRGPLGFWSLVDSAVTTICTCVDCCAANESGPRISATGRAIAQIMLLIVHEKRFLFMMVELRTTVGLLNQGNRGC